MLDFKAIHELKLGVGSRLEMKLSCVPLHHRHQLDSLQAEFQVLDSAQAQLVQFPAPAAVETGRKPNDNYSC
jgi:hypothetical protein